MINVRKRFGIVAVAAGMTTVLAACATGTGATEGATVVETEVDYVTEVAEAPAAPAENVAMGGEPSLWGLTGGAEPMVRASVESWNAAHPDTPIDAEFFANDVFNERIRTAIASGNAPTFIHSWAGGPLREYTDNGQIVDLTGRVDGLVDRLIPAVAANGVVDGRQMGVPNGQTQAVKFYYNREIFEAAGVEAPTTYEELLEVIDRLEEYGVTPIALAAGSRWPLLMWIQYLTDRMCGPEAFTDIINREGEAWLNPCIEDAVAHITDLVDRGAFGDAFGSVMADEQADLALVHTGNAAMILQLGSAFPNFLRNAPEFVEGGNLGWFAFPTMEAEGGIGDPRNIVGNPSHFWSISADATPEEQAVALEFLNTQVLNEDRIEDLLDLGAIPPIEGIRDQIAEHEHADFMTWTYDLIMNAPHFQLSWDQALGGARAQALLDNLSNVFLGQIDAHQFVTNMQAAQ